MPAAVQRTHPAAWLWLSLVVIALDQATKFLVTRFLELYERVEVLPVLDFTLLHNTGAAFSLLAGASGWQRWFFVGLAAVVSVVLVAWIWRTPRGEKLLPLSLALILGGALGNVIDRLAHGYVVDFIHAALGRGLLPGVQHRGQRHHRGRGAADPGCVPGEAGMRILLANPRGFCAGVDRAIDIVERAIGLFGAPIYVRHEVVHNKFVVDRLRSLGAVFVEELDEVPADATVIFSAHGVAKAVQDEARRRGLRVFDATCPLVTKVHMEVTRYAREGRDVILIGHEGHPEVEGTMGQFDESQGGRIVLVEDAADVEQLEVRDPERVGVVTQTTLSVDDTAEVLAALQRRYPTLLTPRKEDICYATQNRQDAVKKLVENCDVVVVVGSRSSSNSNRLREIAEKIGKAGYLVDGPEDLRPEWFEGKATVGVTAGASAPELLVQRVVARLREWGGQGAEEVVGRAENVVFALPRELRPKPVAAGTE